MNRLLFANWTTGIDAPGVDAVELDELRWTDGQRSESVSGQAPWYPDCATTTQAGDVLLR
jgi:hypothetical protein